MSKDITTLDNQLPMQWNQLLTLVFSVLGTIGLVIYTFPWLVRIVLVLVACVNSADSTCLISLGSHLHPHVHPLLCFCLVLPCLIAGD